MKFFTFFFIFQFIFLLSFYSQENDYNPDDNTLRNNALYIQGGGNARTVLSFNYERIVFNSSNNIYHLSSRIGWSIGKNVYDSTLFLVFPFEIIGIIGKRTHFFEAAIGITLNFGNSELKAPDIPEDMNSNFYYFFPIRFGYRLVLENIMIRVSPLLTLLVPTTPRGSELKGFWMPGISMGLMF